MKHPRAKMWIGRLSAILLAAAVFGWCGERVSVALCEHDAHVPASDRPVFAKSDAQLSDIPVPAFPSFWTRRVELAAGPLAGGLVLLVCGIVIVQRMQRREAEKLRLSEERYRVLEELSDNVFFVGSFLDDSLEFNNTYERVFGRRPPAGRKFSDFLLDNEFVYEEDREIFQAFGKKVLSGAPSATAEFRIHRSGGQVAWSQSETVTLFNKAGRPVRTVGKIVNVDEHKRTVLKLREEAETDPLTRVLNRSAVIEQADAFLAVKGRRGVHALLMADLDGFKQANDTAGHQAGDSILIRLAQLMTGLFRAEDLVARLGGDEFCVFVENVGSGEAALRKARALVSAASALSIAEHPEMKISVSVGIAMSGGGAPDFNALYRNADLALYAAKSAGKNRCVLYSPELGGPDAG